MRYFVISFKLIVLLFDHPVYPHRQICYRIKKVENVQVKSHCVWQG